MRARIHVITLAVADLEQALEFYRGGLGLESPGVIGTEFPGDDTNPAGAVWTAISGRSCGIPSLTRRPFENER